MKRKSNTFNITLSSVKGKTKESPNQNRPTIHNLIKINQYYDFKLQRTRNQKPPNYTYSIP